LKIIKFENIGEGFDYGFKKRKDTPSNAELEEDQQETADFKYPEEAFYMITQLNWEDDVVWNGDDIKNKVLQKLNAKGGLASGWLPTATNRMAPSTQKAVPAVTSTPGGKGNAKGGAKSANSKPAAAAAAAAASVADEAADDTRHSIFPVENEELVFGQWEDDIIWDSENMNQLPTPKILTLDTNDENVILAIPDDIDPATKQKYVQQPVKVKIPHPHVRKSKLLLGKAGVINVLEDDGPPPPSENNDKDPYNISNDEFYAAKATEAAIKGTISISNTLI